MEIPENKSVELPMRTQKQNTEILNYKKPSQNNLNELSEESSGEGSESEEEEESEEESSEQEHIQHTKQAEHPQQRLIPI